MTKKVSLKTLIIGGIFSMISMFAFTLSTPATPAVAQTKEDVCDGLALTGAECDKELPRLCADDNYRRQHLEACTTSEDEISALIKDILNILSIVVGVVSVVMVIVGGLKYILSGGDSTQTASAKNTILFAIVGLVIVAFSQIIVRFVLTSV